MSASPTSLGVGTPFASSASSSPMPVRLWSDFSSVPASTAASSPAPEDDGENEMKDVDANANANVEGETPFLRGVPVSVSPAKFKSEEEDASSSPSPLDDPAQIEIEQEQEAEIEQEGELTATQLSRLEHVLERSALYSTILKQQMDDARARHAEERRVASQKQISKKQSPKKRGKGRPAKRRRTVEDSDDEESLPLQSASNEAGEDAKEEPAFPQPALVSGATLKDYQLEGLQWMVGLHEQGISGILADEMGLGKTLQTIAFAAHLRATGTRPFLVVCPLSVLHNWVEEFRRFAPGIPVLMYHGTPAERAEMRRTALPLPEGWPPASSSSSTSASHSKSTSAKNTSGSGNGNGKGRGRPKGAKGKGGKDTSSSKAGSSKASTSKPVPAAAAAPASPARRSGRTSSVRAVPPSPASPARGSTRGRGGNQRGRGGRGGGGRGGGGTVRAGLKRKRVEDEDEDEDEEDGEDEEQDHDEEADEDDDGKPLTKAQIAAKKLEKAHDAHFAAFPVVITTYDLIIRDRPVLGGVPWGYIVVDEGHRLKNMHCALMREVKRYTSAGRMVLTGTPLHNNLAELWSLLNFILPDIFDDVDAFQEWFSLPRMSALLPSARMGTFISTLHTILKPFLLRRMKADVLGSALPPKKSYVLYARLSTRQREAYEAVLAGDVRAWVAGGAGAASSSAFTSTTASSSAAASASASAPVSDRAAADGMKDEDNEEDAGRTLRARRRRGKGKDKEQDAEEEEEERRKAAEAFARRGAAKHVNNMKLQNTVMQLRKVCSHPFLFARPDDDKWALGRAPLTPALLAAREAELLGASGKMLLLDRLLGELFRRGHKVLLFSQFTTMLDIIEDWAVDMKGWKICRIDGTTPPLERRDQMNVFQSAGNAPDAPRLFLLSTRSGGLGVNLTAADTVIFYDQDWNPQMDAQAQDRAHRIGQTKPVLIFRLVSAHTIEEKIMQRATEKRKLEALVIAKGKFKMPAAEAGMGKRTTMAEMAADLLRLEGEQIDVLPATTHAGDTDILSDADLEALLDRSPEVFADRGTGWRSSAKGQAAFAVFEPPPDAGNDALAGMMGEEVAEE
ncbi:SNF2 family N-terminal domain-containing protein [Mycena leptocephala]|nr:SNF2 family N-terminal domain-containing protein [Mycena leptocephala]